MLLSQLAIQTPTYAKQAAQTTTGRRAGDAF